MSSPGSLYDRCFGIVTLLEGYGKELGKIITEDDFNQLHFACWKVQDSEKSDRFSEPMVWIGIYIAISSFICILAMVADLLHGLWSKKFWFPCKFFSLNAASITVITITMKLPVDLSSGMESYLDQSAKVGSLAFMCVMMANLMPSLASMDDNTLLANITGLGILVITIVVNICIQINTGVITNNPYDVHNYSFHFESVMVSCIYMALILMLLIMMISSSLAIPTSKEILESKYQGTNKIYLNDQHLQHTEMSTTEKLRRHVRRYWVMAETGSPQFGMASNPLSTASGVICVVVLVLNFCMVFKSLLRLYGFKTLLFGSRGLYQSPYKGSTLVIFLTQSVGIVVGTIAPLSRCFSVFSFKLGAKWNRNYFMIFKVEKYWTQKLHEWKQSPILFLSGSPRSRSLIYSSKNIILSLCIVLQKVIVMFCKLIWLVVTVVPIFVVSCFTPLTTSRNVDRDEDLSSHALQIDNEMEVAEKTLKGISNAMNSFISNVEKEHSKNLLELLEKSTGFKGVAIFDTDHVQPLLPFELVNSWSLPIVTLTCIIVALPDIHKDEVESLLRSVDEGLSFVHLVEESLNSANEYVNIRKATLILWHEVEHKCKWLDNPLGKSFLKEKTTIEVVKWFSDKAKEIVSAEINESTKEDLFYNPTNALIAANSMYQITQTILHRYQGNIKPITSKLLYSLLNEMIADILCACCTNLPRVIRMRCHESSIVKREANVKVVGKLLAKSTKIIERLDTREVPSMDDEKMAYIDEWRLYLKQSFP